MPGTLYVVATPIGNLEELTPRAASALAEANFIAAEDTRITLKLLNHLGLKKPMISYNRHNAEVRGPEILRRIEAGECCSLCSDAGTPAVSDPGELLVADAHARGIHVVPVAGPCAAITALCVSGQPTGRFVFEGFLSRNRRLRSARMATLKNEERTLLFYEAPHRLAVTLCCMRDVFGAYRPLTLCRELTKRHEQIWRTTLGEAAGYYETHLPKGEFVLVVAGAPPAKVGPEVSLEEAAALAAALASEQGISASAAARRAAAETGHSKNGIYRMMQQIP